MKKKFIAGLIFLIPLAITFWFLSSIISLLITPFRDITAFFLHWMNILPNGFLCFSHEQLISFLSGIIALFTLMSLSIGTGIISEKYISHSFRKWLDDLLMQIPLFNSVYNVCKRITSGLFVEKKSIKTSVVLNNFMSQSQQTLSIVTNKVIIEKVGFAPKAYHVTLLPSTPNPTGAYLVFSPVESQQPVPDVSTEEAFRFVISCGTSPTTL